MAKVRVYELAKEFGVESKAVMAKLQEMGEFVRSASSTIEAPVVRRLKEAFTAQAGKAQEKRPAAQRAVRRPVMASSGPTAAPRRGTSCANRGGTCCGGTCRGGACRGGACRGGTCAGG